MILSCTALQDIRSFRVEALRVDGSNDLALHVKNVPCPGDKRQYGGLIDNLTPFVIEEYACRKIELAKELQFDELDTKCIHPIETEGLQVLDDAQVRLADCTRTLENLILPVRNVKLSLLVSVNKLQQLRDALEVTPICEYMKVQGNEVEYEGS